MNDQMGMNPEMMQQVMNMPGMQEHMQRMMQNPQLLQSMMESNPQMRAMLDNNPQLRQTLQNPEVSAIWHICCLHEQSGLSCHRPDHADAPSDGKP